MSRAVLVASLALLSACKSAPRPFPDPVEVEAPPVRVPFQPPLGQPIIERSVTVRAEQAAGSPQVEETVSATLRSRFDADGERFLLTQSVDEVRVTLNGQPVENPLVQLVTRFTLELRLAADGSFVELTNPQAAEQAVRETFPDEDAAAVLRYFTPDAIELQAKEEWNTKYGALLGRDVAPGLAWYGLESVGTSGGQSLAYVVERKVVGVRQGEGGREVVIAFSCPKDESGARDPAAMRALLEQKGSPALEPTVACKGEQVVGVEPFVPRSSSLEVTASPALESGGKVNILLQRTVRTEHVGATQPPEEGA